jgi:hypothetical protein
MSMHGVGIAIFISPVVSAYGANPFLDPKDDKPVARFERDALNRVVVAIFSEDCKATMTLLLTRGTGLDQPAIVGEYTATGKTVGEEHRKRHLMWLLVFLGFLVVLSLLGGLHRAARRGVSYSKTGAHWTIDWKEVLFF